MTSGAIMARNACTSRSASVFAKAISVARTCCASAARSSAKAGAAQSINASNSCFMGYLPVYASDSTFGGEVPCSPGGTMRSIRRPGEHMGAFTTLMARDGHEFNAWLSPAAAGARGTVVLCQEIFGVNHHIRGVAD